MLLPRTYNVKQKATTAILCRRVKLRSAQELCDFLTKNFSRPAASSFPSRQKSMQLKRRVFFNLPFSGALAVSRNQEGGRFCTVKGIRQLRSVRTCSEQLKIFTRARACYCHNCLARCYNGRENMEWVGNWKEVKLAREPSGSTTRAAEDVTTTEQPAQLLIWQPKTALWLWQQRMTVTMINNYLLKITSDGITKLKDSFKDPYGNIFKKGQFVLQGTFFRLGKLIRHIKLMKRWQQCFQGLYIIFVVP